MGDKFITLNCKNCGGKIDVYEDMQRFNCGYCGTDMVVQRRGGAVLLEKLTEVVAKAHISVDRASTEIETVRLTHERDELLDKLTGMNNDFEKVIYVIGGALVLLLAPLYWYNVKWLWVVVIAGGPLGYGAYRLIIRHRDKMRDVQIQIDTINARMEELKKPKA